MLDTITMTGHELKFVTFETGTKSDMRVPNSDKFVSKDDGKKLAKKISAFAFVECSAKRKINLQKVFEEAVNAVEFKNKPDCRCIIL